MAYQPIESYGVIGDMRTAALVGATGSIDWLCFPHFDSPSVFAAVLDDHEGGRFEISPVAEGFRCKQLYWPDRNVFELAAVPDEGGVEELAAHGPDPAFRVRHRSWSRSLLAPA